MHRLSWTETGIPMDHEKLDIVRGWSTPCTVKELQRFLGFANFYWIFTKNCSSSIMWTIAINKVF